MTPKEWAIAHVGDGYIYGARGQKCSLAFREQQAKQYPAQADMILGTGAKWDGHQVWDCAQFTRYAWKNAGVELCSGATSQWRKTNWEESGTIDQLPADAVCSLFRMSGSTMQHTGLYLGDGTFIHAKGTKYGVLHEKLDAYNWTHYGIPAESGEEPMEPLYTAKVTAENGLPVKLRKSAGKDASVIGKLSCGTLVDVYEEADGWSRIGSDGTTGWMMSKFLRRTDESPAADQDGAEADSSGLYIYEKLAELERRIAALEDASAEG